MSIVSLGSSQVAGFAGSNLSRAQNQAALSVARLSSGSRIVRAADDVAALSVATNLQSKIITLRQSINNALQADSYLAIADASLANIDEMLQRMAAISLQAGSGALTNSDRSFLDLEFRNLMEEIDRTAASSNFNNVKVLQREAEIAYAGLRFNDTQSLQSNATLSFFSNIELGEDIVLNGVVLVENVDFLRGSSINETVANITTALQDSTDIRLQEAMYEQFSNQILITSRSTGSLSSLFTVAEQSSSGRGDFETLNALKVGTGDRYILSGGIDEGIRAGQVSVGGSVSGSLITDQSLDVSERFFSIDTAIFSNFADGDFLTIDPGGGPSLGFTFEDVSDPNDVQSVQIGANTEESMRNFTTALNKYITDPEIDASNGTRIFGPLQLESYRDGDVVHIRSKLNGSTEDYGGKVGVIYTANPLDLAESTNGTWSSTGSGDLGNGFFNGGVNADRVSNADFIGRLSGFEATYKGADSVEASITIGEHTYTALIADTTPAADTTIQFNSDTGGGFFQMIISSGGLGVSNQGDAVAYAEALDAAVSPLKFYQDRELEFIATNSDMNKTNITYTTDSIDPIIVENVNVVAADGGDSATITFQVNGTTYTSRNEIGSAIGEYEIFEFESSSNSKDIITISTEDVSYDLSTESDATDLQTLLEKALISPEQNRRVPEAEEVRFFISSDAKTDITVKIDITSTKALFDNPDISIGTEDSAIIAFDAVKLAIDGITARRANVGSLQSRMGFAVNQMNSALLNQDAARATLVDTDISVESTNFALTQVKINASISVIAQLNSLRQDLVTTLYDSF